MNVIKASPPVYLVATVDVWVPSQESMNDSPLDARDGKLGADLSEIMTLKYPTAAAGSWLKTHWTVQAETLTQQLRWKKCDKDPWIDTKTLWKGSGNRQS